MSDPVSTGASKPPTPLPYAQARKQQSAEAFEDCTPCRLTGSVAFTGLGIYTWYSGTKQLRERELEVMQRVHSGATRWGLGARRAAVGATSAVLVAMGAYRLVN